MARERIRRSPAQWQALVKEYESGELTRERFCGQHSISASSLSYWRRKLGEEASGFIELPAASRASGGWEVELALGEGMLLRLRRA